MEKMISMMWLKDSLLLALQKEGAAKAS